MHRYQRIILILFCVAILWASIWVPLHGKAINMREMEITSYHWIWNTDRIYWRGLMAIPSHIDYGRLILSYIAIASLFGGIYAFLGLVLRRKMNATQSEIEDKISSENLKCPKCKVAPLVGVDGKRQEVFLLCPECETEWYFRQEPIRDMVSSLRRCLNESDRPPVCVKSLQIKKVLSEQKSMEINPVGIIDKQSTTELDGKKTCPLCHKELHFKTEGTGSYWHCDYPICSFVEVVKR